MKCELSLHAAATPQRTACAWFVPGDSAAIWLDALAQLPLDQSRARILVVPRSPTDRRPLGALIVQELAEAKRGGPEPSQHPGRTTRGRRSIACPYGLVGGRLYAPIEAVVRPPATDAELESLLADDAIHVWHPIAGLVPFSPQDCHRAADFVSAPAESAAEWNRASPGTAYNCRLLSLSMTAAPTLDELIEQARDEIGSRAGELASLPPSPREPRAGVLSAVKRRVTTAIARFALWLSNLGPQPGTAVIRRQFHVGRAVRWLVGALMAALLILFVIYVVGSILHSSLSLDELLGAILVVAMVAWLLKAIFEGVSFFTRRAEARARRKAPARPQSAAQAKTTATAGAGWLSRLGKWASSKLQEVTDSIRAARNRELDRLVDALENDPDAGLRFAIPLAGDVPRGVGAPGARLKDRTVDFGRGGSSGGLADYWDIQGEYRRKLTEKYRTLANREISLGRHRRAAYIFAELLGDWNAAARTLADGGHYREAAVVYSERLKRPLDAAQCLERGGLLSEAIVIYDQLGQHETVGNLYAKLDQPDEAKQAYRRAVDVKRAASDRLGAAALLESKLEAPDEAWTELAGGWPASQQAEHCLREAFAWTERHDDADRAKRFLRDASERAKTSGQAVQLVGCISSVATDYPEPTVRAAATEGVLSIASARLPQATTAELTGLTKALRHLAPEDRLLSRDCDRYSRDRAPAAQAQSWPNVYDTQSQAMLQLRREIKLPFDNVRACVASADTFYAAGWRHQELVIIRGNWNGTVQYPAGAPWRCPKATAESPILMGVEPVGEEFVYVHPAGMTPVGYYRTFPITDQMRRAVGAGGFSGLTPNTCGLSVDTKVQVVDFGSSAFMMRLYHGKSLSLAETTWCAYPSLEAHEADADRTLADPLPYQRRGQSHFFAIGTTVYGVGGNELKPLFECDDNVLRLVASPVSTRRRIIAVLPLGAQIIWGVAAGSSATRFASDMAHPHVLMHRDGWIIAADRRGCQIFVFKRDAMQPHVAMQWEDHGEVVALLPAQLPNVFAVCFASGHILQYQIPTAR